MTALFDLLPVIAFFIAYKVSGIYVATAVLMATTVVALVLTWLKTRTLSKMVLGSAVLVFVFGAATLYFHSPVALQWMPTVLYSALATVFAASHLTESTVVERLLGAQFIADKRVWTRANAAWVVFFVLLAALNLIVMRRYGLDVWVGFKVAKIGAIFVFAILQALWLASRAKPRPELS